MSLCEFLEAVERVEAREWWRGDKETEDNSGYIIPGHPNVVCDTNAVIGRVRRVIFSLPMRTRTVYVLQG
jgi:hypothetical protein